MISAILLAAGESKRMKGINKLTKKINDIPLIEHSVKNILSSAVDELIIVLGFQELLIKNILGEHKKIKFVVNKDFKNGISSSIKSGIKNLSVKSDAFFICLGDMPFVSKYIYNKLIKSIDDNEIIIPKYNGEQGNPILFSSKIKSEILKIDGDFGAKKILSMNKYKSLSININDKSILVDFNTQNKFKI